MHSKIEEIGADWIAEIIGGLTEEINHVTPSAFNEANRYLPESVTSMPGYIRYSVNPFMREILDCFDVDSPIREVALKKGVQITYSTVLESGAFYYMAHVRTLPIMYITADKELAKARIENNFLPMLNQSGYGHIIRSSDIGSTRKTGKTANHLQFEGGGYMVPFGARNADKMRSYSIAIMLKDEIDAWPDIVGKDGDPDALTSDRCSGYWERRKIFRGSTPLIKGTSKIEKAYLRGDQRKYMVRCKKCNYQQVLRWKKINEKNGIVGGFDWEIDNGQLVHESVAYHCQECGEPHYEHDKEALFSPEHGAEWVPTARPAEPDIRSYHLPGFYSPIGLQPWYKCVAQYLEAWDTEANRVRDVGKLQQFYNNILAEAFEIEGRKIKFRSVSAHRRPVYRMGEIPNKYAVQYSGGKVLFVTCQVDVHPKFLRVAVMGWTINARCYIIEYLRFEAENCEELASPVWQEVRDVIEGREYTADDGTKYKINLTLIDAGYANATVLSFCSEYAAGVCPIIGRDRPAKGQRIKEFTPYKTQQGILGYQIVVDHYKDRMAPVLRREWSEAAGVQREYHFNAPVDISDDDLAELTKEKLREKVDPRGGTTYEWYKAPRDRNELWDLLGYGYAAVEIIAYVVCIERFELENVDWAQFWEYVKQTPELFARVDGE